MVSQEFSGSTWLRGDVSKKKPGEAKYRLLLRSHRAVRAVGVNVSPAQNPKARNDLKVPTLVSMNIIPCGICDRNVTQSQTCIRRNKKKPRLERG